MFKVAKLSLYHLPTFAFVFAVTSPVFSQTGESHEVGSPKTLPAFSSLLVNSEVKPVPLRASVFRSIGQQIRQTAKAETQENSELTLKSNSTGSETSGELNSFIDTVPNSTAPSLGSVGPIAMDAGGYTLTQLQEMAISHNPTIGAAAFEMERVSGLRVQSSLQPNPTLGYFGMQLADEGTDQHGIFVERQFVRGNKLELNDRVFERSLQVSQHQISVVQQKVMTDVQKLYYQASAAQLKIQLIQDFMKVADRGVEVAQDRKDAEEASQIEVLQAKTLQSETRMSLTQAEAAFRGVRERLATLVGLANAEELNLYVDLPRIESIPDWRMRLESLVAASPEMAVAQAALCEAEAFLQRQQIQATPNITAQIGAGVDNSTNSGMINLQFTAPIPVRNRNQGNISAARAAYHKAASEVERVRQSLAARLANLAADYETSLASVQNLTENILPQINETLELSEQAYVAGELDFLQVAVIRKNLYDSQIRWIDARVDLSQSQARLDGLMLEGAWDSNSQFGFDGLRGQALDGE